MSERFYLMRLPLVLFFSLLFVALNAAHAQTSFDASGADGGSIIPGYDSRACGGGGAPGGAIRYNSATSCAEFCDGSSWLCPNSGGGCTAPASCPNVGDVCGDGSLFAGFMLYGGNSCEPLYVTDNNQSTSSQWKTTCCTNDITNPDDHVDGQYNRDNRGSGTFPAFELCENNTYHGNSDWYLPARAELNLLWLNRAAINVNAAGNFTTQGYWSSTEYATDGGWDQRFSDGLQWDYGKTNSYDVRCVRRD